MKFFKTEINKLEDYAFKSYEQEETRRRKLYEVQDNKLRQAQRDEDNFKLDDGSLNQLLKLEDRRYSTFLEWTLEKQQLNSITSYFESGDYFKDFKQKLDKVSIDDAFYV